jgi:exonuclease SbcD
LRLSEELKTVLRRDIRVAFERACALAREESVDLVLIPGDLFDHESLQHDTPELITQLLADLAPARVFVAPGNHDSLRPGSPYHPRQGARWPENVHVFTSPEMECVNVRELGCSVTGMAHVHGGVKERLSDLAIPQPPTDISFLMLHGSREGFRPIEKECVVPFTDAELVSLGFTYAALGHYHSFAQIVDGSGLTRAAYSGCIQGRGLDETGEKSVIIGEVGSDGRASVRRVEVAPRRLISVETSLTGCATEVRAIERIASAVAASGARACDIVNVVLTGSTTSSVKPDALNLENQNCFHLSIDPSRLRPDYDLDEIAAAAGGGSVRSMFVKRLMEMRENLDDGEEREVVLDAIYYGLLALDGRPVEPRDAS